MYYEIFNTIVPAYKQEICESRKGFDLFNQIWSPWFDILLLISGVATLLVTITIFYNKNLRQHPADVVGMIAFLFSYECFGGLSFRFICPFNGQWLFAYTVYYDTSEASQIKAFNVLYYAFSFTIVLVINAPAILEGCLLIDLILTLKRPM